MIFRRGKRRKATSVTTLAELEDLIGSGRPVLVDFMQFGCAACKVMDGIVDELADEFGDSAHVVKVNVGRVPGAADRFRIRSTPTFVVMATSDRSHRKARLQGTTPKATQRYRSSGLVKKDVLHKLLVSNGASPTAGAE